MSSAVEKLAAYICDQCHFSLLQDHPTDYLWLKCGACGFCRLKKAKDD